MNISSTNIHAYILGEHGDSSFVPWMNTYIGCKSMMEYIVEMNIDMNEMHKIYKEVQQAEYKQEGLYIGVPAIINRQGISKIMTLHLNNVDQHKFDRSCETLKEMIDGELEAIINS